MTYIFTLKACECCGALRLFDKNGFVYDERVFNNQQDAEIYLKLVGIRAVIK